MNARLPPIRRRAPSAAPVGRGGGTYWQDALLHALGGELALDGIAFDEQRCCILRFDDVVIQIHATGEQYLLLTAPLFMLTRPLQADTLADLLAANLYGEGTGGGMLALDKERALVLLQDRVYRHNAELHFVLDRLTAMADAAERWRRQMHASSIITLEE